MKDNTEAMKQLNETAKKISEYTLDRNNFIQGARSPEAANGCNNHVEKAKIDFAIDLLKIHRVAPEEYDSDFYSYLNDIISELTEQRKQYEH